MATWHERLRAGTAYVALAMIAQLSWEVAQLPLYSNWTTATRAELAFDVLHCTAGDMIMAAASLAAALVVTRARSWPDGDWLAPVGVALVFGLAYTAFSEWHNVYVRHSWSYSEAMPVVQVGSIAIGVAPLLQWIFAPGIAFAVLRWSWEKGPPRTVR